MFKKVMVIGLALLIAGLILSKKRDDVTTVGIIQTASHPALDQVREQFIQELEKLSDNKVRFVVQNAEGSQAEAHSIAQNFHSHAHIDALFAIGTPAVQASARKEKNKPIFIAAVSDPEPLQLGTNVCGTTDRVDTDAQVDLVLRLVPSVQTVAILYNPEETNSEASVARLKESIAKCQLKAVTVTARLESEVAQAAMLGCKKGDVLIVPTDNLIARAMSVVARQAALSKKPLFVSDILLVKHGALAGCGASYSDLGKQSARIAFQVLFEGILPKTIGIQDPKSTSIVLNEEIGHE